MLEYTHDFIIQQPVQTVFAFLTDAANYARWDAASVEMVPAEPGPWRVGLRFHEVRMAMGKMKVETEITELVPNRSLATRSLSGPQYSGRWTFEPSADGTATHLRFEARLTLDLLMQMVAPMVEKMFRQQLDASLPRLKAVLEADV